MQLTVGERRTDRYIRHGTTTLFAALDVATGRVIGKCFRRHRAKEFTKFLREIDENVPEEQSVHVVLDLRHAQDTGREAMASSPPAIPPTLHADQLLMAEPGRELFLTAGETTS